MSEKDPRKALLKAVHTPKAVRASVDVGLRSHEFHFAGRRGSCPLRIRGLSSVFRLPALGYTNAKGTARFVDTTFTGQLLFSFTPAPGADADDLPTDTVVQAMPSAADLTSQFSEVAEAPFVRDPKVMAPHLPLGAMCAVRRPRGASGGGSTLAATWVGDEVPQRWMAWADLMAMEASTTSWNFVGVFRVHDSHVWDPPQLFLAPAAFTPDGKQTPVTAVQLRDVAEPPVDVGGEAWTQEDNAVQWAKLGRRTALHKWVLGSTTVAAGTPLADVLPVWAQVRQAGGHEVRDAVDDQVRAMVLHVTHALETMRAATGAMHIALDDTCVVGVQCGRRTERIVCLHEDPARPGTVFVVHLPLRGVLWRLTNFVAVASDVLFGFNDRAAAMALWDVEALSLAHVYRSVSAGIPKRLKDVLDAAPVALWDVVKLVLVLALYQFDDVVKDIQDALRAVIRANASRKLMTLEEALALCAQARGTKVGPLVYRPATEASKLLVRPDPGAQAVAAILETLTGGLQASQHCVPQFLQTLATKWGACDPDGDMDVPKEEAYEKLYKDSKLPVAWVPISDRSKSMYLKTYPVTQFTWLFTMTEAYHRAWQKKLKRQWHQKTLNLRSLVRVWNHDWMDIEGRAEELGAKGALADYRTVWQRELRIAPALVAKVQSVAGSGDTAERIRDLVQALLDALTNVTTFQALKTTGEQLVGVIDSLLRAGEYMEAGDPDKASRALRRLLSKKT